MFASYRQPNASGRFLLVATLTLFSSDAVRAADAVECRWAPSPPVIDGKIDEAVWQRAQIVENFQSAWLPDPARRKPPTATKARLLWDREYLYFSAEMEDTDVFAHITEHDAAIWTCDVFELFFKPARDQTGYYEFQVNAANGKLDMFVPSRGAGGYSRHKSERDFHLESAVQIQGTLNQWADEDRGWTVEGRIPWRDFLSTGGRPVPGEEWLHTLCRYDYSVGFDEPALSASAPLSLPKFNYYEDYIPVKFIGPSDRASTRRVPWDASRLVGSPDQALPYQNVSAFPKLRTKQPAMIAVEPGRESLLLLETNGYSPVRVGRVSRIANDSDPIEPELLLELSESIYDVCFHPKFAENGYLFLGANGRFGPNKSDFNTRVLRYTMDRTNGRIDPASRQVIIEWHSQGHNGGALTFGHDGMLYVTSGDGTSDSDEWSAGQDLTRLLAKLLRIDVDRPTEGKLYAVPPDNPFLDTAKARPETWAYGFRNPWRMTMDRKTGDLWVGENGQDLWEFARIVRRGENYGWPVVEGSHPFHQNRPQGPTPITKPLIEHSHTDFRSLTGGIVYYGAKFPDLEGCYVYGDYSTGQIWAAKHRDGKLIRHERIAAKLRRKERSSINHRGRRRRHRRYFPVFIENLVAAIHASRDAARPNPQVPGDELHIGAGRVERRVAPQVRRGHHIVPQRIAVAVVINPTGIVLRDAPLAASHGGIALEFPAAEMTETHRVIRRVNPVVERPHEPVGGMLDIGLATIVVGDFDSIVRDTVAIRVAEKPQMRRLGHQQPIADESQGARHDELLGEHDPLVVAAIAVGVRQRGDDAHGLIFPDAAHVGHVTSHLDHPQAPVRPELHGDRISHQRIRGDQLRPESRRELERRPFRFRRQHRRRRHLDVGRQRILVFVPFIAALGQERRAGEENEGEAKGARHRKNDAPKTQLVRGVVNGRREGNVSIFLIATRYSLPATCHLMKSSQT